MRIEIEIQNEEAIIERRGEYEFHKQPAYCYTFDRNGNKAGYPQAMKITLKKNQAPYKKGMYLLAPDSIYINRYGELSVYPSLQPVAPQAVQSPKSAAA